MTGIERLRELGNGYIEHAWSAAGKSRGMLIIDIADQIEREHVSRMRVMAVLSDMERHVSGHEGAEDSPVAHWARELRDALKSDASTAAEHQNPSWHDPADAADATSEAAKVTRDPADDVSMSAYDLLPEDERDAIAWVREHGGLERIKQQRIESIPRDAYERKRDGWLDHIAECEAALGKRNERIAELEARLDGFQKTQKVGVSLTSHSDESPAPKVLDADGVEIYKGDTVWTTRDLDKFTVTNANNGKFLSVSCKGEDGEDYCCYPTDLTHRAPVLAADGRPLRKGETVWYLDHIDPLEVRSVSTTASCGSYAKAYNDYEGELSAPARCFSHERPEIDSWERLEEDATVSPEAYCAKRGIDFSDVDGQHRVLDEVTERMARDLVRRARALAGVSE